MGTTGTTLHDDPGAQLCFVLAIEGHDTLLTSHDDAAAVETAWAGTDWSAAMRGLLPPGEIESEIEPFRPKLDHGSLTFVVIPDEDDTFAEAVFAPELATGHITELTADVDPEDTTINVKSTSGWASEGFVFIGTECMYYSSKTSTTLSVSAGNRARFSPFNAGGSTTNKFARWHRLHNRNGEPIAAPKVTDYPRTWIGKWVALYVHVVRGGVVDVVAQAELLWSGRIADVRGAPDGTTQLACTDAREAIDSTVLMQDQFVGRLGNAHPFHEGMSIRLVESTDLDTTISRYVIGGADGELEPGTYTAEEIIASINEWIRAEANMPSDWSFNVRSDGLVSILIGFDTTGVQRCFASVTAHAAFWATLGWDVFGRPTLDSDDFEDSPIVLPNGDTTSSFHLEIDKTRVLDSPTLLFLSDGSPLVAIIPPLSERLFGSSGELTLESVTGTWINQTSELPDFILRAVGAEDDEDWGLMDIGGRAIAVVRRDSDTYFDQVFVLKDLNDLLGAGRIELQQEPSTAEVVCRQVLLLQGPAVELVPKLLATTGQEGYNHATFDVLGYGLGAAIPWDLLGFALVESVRGMFWDAPTMTLVLERPTRLADVLLPELMLRNAALVQRAGKLLFLAPASSTTVTASFALDESNKAAPPDRPEQNRSEWEYTRRFLVNHITVKYNRKALRDEYTGLIEASNEASKTDFGIAEPITIEARNTMGDANQLDDSIQDVIFGLAGLGLTRFAQPLLRLTRSTDFSLYDAVAGDTCSVTDSHVRDPETGQRGLSGKTGWILSHRFDWQERTGLMEILVVDDDRYGLYSPCADVDDTADADGFTSGYNNGTRTVRCYAHRYSLSGETQDAQRFAAGDDVGIDELSPADPTSPLQWVRVVESVSGNDIVLTATLSSPTFDDTKKYRVRSRKYDEAEPTQQADVYLADDADGLVSTFRRAYNWGIQPPDTGDTGTAYDVDPTRPHEYPLDNGTWESELFPVHPGMHRAAIDTINNFISFKSAPQQPMLWSSVASFSDGEYELLGVFLLYTGPGLWDRAKIRRLYVAPMFRITNDSGGDVVTVRVSASYLPPTGDSLGAVDAFQASKRSVEFTTTSEDLAIPSAQALELVRFPGESVGTFLIIEGKTEGQNGECWGLARCFLGPVGD
jgi:hypothetical protein